MELLTDEQLIRLVRHGDLPAFRILVERHQDQVYAWIIRKVNVKEAAEELVQDVFFKAYRGMSGFREDARFTTWLYQLTSRTVIDYWRKHRRSPLPVLLDSIRNWFSERSYEPEQQLLLQEEREVIGDLMKRLPVKYREILHLYYVDECSYSDIAERLRLSLRTVETRLYRGKAMLRTYWLEVKSRDEDSSQRSTAAAGTKQKIERI